MANKTPLVLPEDFMAQWSEQVEVNHQPSTLLSNPFNDSKAPTRLTATGFTTEDSTVLDDYLEELKQEKSRKTQSTHNTIRNKGKMTDFEMPQRERYGLSDYYGGQESTNQYRDDFRQSHEESPPQKDYVTMKDFENFTKMVSKSLSIHPSDSASNVKGSRQFPPLAIVPSALRSIDEVNSDVDETVVGGYWMTAKEKTIELDSYAKVEPVHGLPKVFNSARLNFLTHVHSALFEILTDDDGRYPADNSLDRLLDSRKSWPKTPSTDLLETVINSSLDLRTGVVKSNPFRLPVLKPTMVLTPKLMYMSLDQLHNEFEIEWFNTMESVTTPKFKSKYEGRRFQSERRHRTTRSGETRRSSGSSSSRAGNSRKSSVSESKSVLSGLFG